MSVSGLSDIGTDEDLPVANVHDVYPTVDPTQFIDARTFEGKVVLITGASRGIGLETSLHYARAGASLTLVSRIQATVKETKAAVLGKIPTAQVHTYAADVRDFKGSRGNDHEIRTAGRLGRLDVRGVYNFIHFSIQELPKTKVSIIVVSSAAAELRVPAMSDYSTSKHTLGCVFEFVAICAFSQRPLCVGYVGYWRGRTRLEGKDRGAARTRQQAFHPPVEFVLLVAYQTHDTSRMAFVFRRIYSSST